jgi:very-short-patch-repair endonuclease
MSLGLVLMIAAAVVLVVIVFLILSKKGESGPAGDWPFYPRKPLSQPEQVLYFRLVEALPEHVVLAQVQLSRFLGVKKGNNFQQWMNRINRMSADFVICNRDFSIAAVVELDDATHERADRKAADAKKDKALASAGLRIIRWQAKSLPDAAAIRSAIAGT